MVYPIMNPPFGAKRNRDMTVDEAKVHYNWYMNIIPDRMELLREACQSQTWNKYAFDYTRDSLLPLWEWYLKNVRIVPKSTEEYNKEKVNKPDYMIKNIPKERVGIGWIQIPEDIGIYFSLCLLKYSPKLKWD